LEDRLHALVVNGKLDLETAQREIAADWITAYKKYVGPSPAAVTNESALPIRVAKRRRQPNPPQLKFG